MIAGVLAGSLAHANLGIEPRKLGRIKPGAWGLCLFSTSFSVWPTNLFLAASQYSLSKADLSEIFSE